MIRPMLPRQRFQWRVPVGTHGADQAEQIVTLLRQIDVLRSQRLPKTEGSYFLGRIMGAKTLVRWAKYNLLIKSES
jgi:hypothetical protein